MQISAVLVLISCSYKTRQQIAGRQHSYETATVTALSLLSIILWMLLKTNTIRPHTNSLSRFTKLLMQYLVLHNQLEYVKFLQIVLVSNKQVMFTLIALYQRKDSPTSRMKGHDNLHCALPTEHPLIDNSSSDQSAHSLAGQSHHPAQTQLLHPFQSQCT